jgi:hypothetical protein
MLVLCSVKTPCSVSKKLIIGSKPPPYYGRINILLSDIAEMKFTKLAGKHTVLS